MRIATSGCTDRKARAKQQDFGRTKTGTANRVLLTEAVNPQFIRDWGSGKEDATCAHVARQSWTRPADNSVENCRCGGAVTHGCYRFGKLVLAVLAGSDVDRGLTSNIATVGIKLCKWRRKVIITKKGMHRQLFVTCAPTEKVTVER